jgi:hypothetical protein
MINFKVLGKEEAKPKISRWIEIIKTSVEINEMKHKRISETKTWFFEKYTRWTNF